MTRRRNSNGPAGVNFRSGRYNFLKRPLAIESLESRRMFALDVELLKDLDTTPRDYNPGITAIVEMNGVAYFAAKASQRLGTTLWRSDGTESGTFMVRDITQMSGPTNINPGTAKFGVLDGVLYFQASGQNGAELWRSDGTADGTYQLMDLFPGSGGSNPRVLGVAEAHLYFTASSTIWRTDGTVAGTIPLRTFGNGSFGHGIDGSQQTASIGSVFYFRANDGVQGNEVWRTDGTVAGTYILKDLNVGAAGSEGPSFLGQRWLANVDGTLFFSADDGLSGTEVWKSDGTAGGTVLVKDAAPGAAGSNPTGFVNFNGALYFGASNGSSGSELWKSDGTDAGTTIVKDILPGAGSGIFGWIFATTSDAIYFRANDGVHGNELWKSDGTAAGTVLVKDVTPGALGANDNFMAVVDDVVYFGGNDGVNGEELWRSDGTEAGTYILKEFYVGASGGNPKLLTNVGGTLFFTAMLDKGLWTSDGTAAGTGMIKDLRAENLSSGAMHFTRVGETTYFSAQQGSRRQLWKTDGTAANTVQVSDFTASYALDHFHNVGGVLYFTATDYSLNVATLWKSDGTLGGTVLLGELGNDLALQFPKFLATSDTLHFTTRDTQLSRQFLWKSDGTAAGTAVITTDVAPASNITDLLELNGEIYFSGVTAAHGTELWKTNGTAAGTVRVTNFAPVDSTLLFPLQAMDGWIYFQMNDGVSGRELWRTDGTAGGTALVVDINPGSSSGVDFDRSVVIDGILYFKANDGVHGKELWRTDGTAAGTYIVKDITPGAASTQFSELDMLNANGTLYFVANDGVHGKELWKSDGTTAGTALVKDIWSSAQYPQGLVNIGSKVYFLGNGTSATIWETDGTEAGTVGVDILPLIASNGDPGALATDGDILYFGATISAYGTEPWIARPTAPLPLQGDYNNDGRVDGADFLAWQRGFGSAATPAGSGADGDGDGAIGAGDLDVWKNRFDSPTPSSAASSAAVAAFVAPAIAAVDEFEIDEFNADSVNFPAAQNEAASSRLAARDALFAAGDFQLIYAAEFAELPGTRWRRRR